MENSEILSLLSNFRYLFKEIIENEFSVINELNKCSYSDEKIFPCDFIDLRKIFINMEIEFPNKIPLVPQSFADRFLKRYSIFLVIDCSNIKIETFNYKGLSIIDSPKLNIRDTLKKIVINKSKEDKIYEKVSSLLKNLRINIECIVSNSIPGLSSAIPNVSM